MAPQGNFTNGVGSHAGAQPRPDLSLSPIRAFTQDWAKTAEVVNQLYFGAPL